jgi:hypothetical protein
VRQGGVLSPTIFLMIVDEMMRKLHRKAENILIGVSEKNLKNYILHIYLVSLTPLLTWERSSATLKGKEALPDCRHFVKKKPRHKEFIPK